MTAEEQRIETFIGFVGIAAAALAIATMGGMTPDPYRPVAHQSLLAPLFVIATVLLARFPVHLTYKTKVYVDTSVLTAAAILFGVPWAIAVGAASVALNEALLRDSWEQAVFNIAQTIIYVGVGATVYHLIAPLPFPIAIPGDGNAVAVPACAAAMYGLNTVLVAAIGGRQVGISAWKSLRASAWLGLPEHLVLASFAAVFAAMARESAWVLPMLAVPTSIAYVSLRRGVQAQGTASEALHALATVADLRHATRTEHSERVAAHAQLLAIRLGLSPRETEDVVAAARFHEVGTVLLDPRSDSQPAPDDQAIDPEFHSPIAGADLVGSLSLFGLAARYIRHHREHWDGSGYPDGIAGECIPFGARIVGVADAYDELSMAANDGPDSCGDPALLKLKNDAGSVWDPSVIAALAGLTDGNHASTPN
jgi:hypothetical protein